MNQAWAAAIPGKKFEFLDFNSKQKMSLSVFSFELMPTSTQNVYIGTRLTKNAKITNKKFNFWKLPIHFGVAAAHICLIITLESHGTYKSIIESCACIDDIIEMILISSSFFLLSVLWHRICNAFWLPFSLQQKLDWRTLIFFFCMASKKNLFCTLS